MKSARRWLAERRLRLERLPRLENALLGEAPRRYAVHRLRYTAFRAVVRTAFRLVELAVFTLALPFEVLAPVLLVRSGLLVAESLWWGALETLRRDVRVLHSRGEAPVSVIRKWLALASLGAALSLLLGLGWVGWGPSPFPGFDVVDAFVLACASRFGMDLLARAYHSGVYGIVRVHRPLWSLFLVDVADVVVMLAGYLWLGAWGFGLAFLSVGALRCWLGWLFTHRTYAELRLSVGGARRWFSHLRRGGFAWRHTLLAALGNAVAQVDALLVLGLLSVPGEGALLLAALFHGVAPLQAAAFAWSRPFYFDFKRLEAWGSPFLLRRFEEFLGRVAWLVPLPIGLLTLLLLMALWRGPYALLALGLFALAAVRARLSLLHVHAYSLGDHAFLARLFLGMMGVVALTPLVGRLPPEASVGVIALLGGLGLLVLGRSQKRLTALRGRTLGLAVWLSALLDSRGPVRLGLLRVDRRLANAASVLHAVLPELEGATLTRLGRDTFAWFAPAAAAARLSPQGLIVRGAGALRELELGAPAATGRQALAMGVPGQAWQRHLGRFVEHGEREALDTAGLEAALARLAPGARCVELRDLDGKATAGHSLGELRRVVMRAARGRQGFTRVGNAEAAVLAPGGEPRVLVLVPKAPERPSWRAEATELLCRAEVTLTLDRHYS